LDKNGDVAILSSMKNPDIHEYKHAYIYCTSDGHMMKGEISCKRK